MKEASILYIHWAMNPERSRIMRESFDSILRTTDESVEILVGDNGGSYEDSEYFLRLADEGRISTYTRYRYNMGFARVRNDLLNLASGEFIAFVDNDIVVTDNWLADCIAWLRATPGKHLASPVRADNMNRMRPDRWAGEENGWRLNYRGGSNCWILRRSDLEAIGRFEIIKISASKWCDRFVKMGYTVGMMPEPKATDLGFRNGFDFRNPQESLVL